MNWFQLCELKGNLHIFYVHTIIQLLLHLRGIPPMKSTFHVPLCISIHRQIEGLIVFGYVWRNIDNTDVCLFICFQDQCENEKILTQAQRIHQELLSLMIDLAEKNLPVCIKRFHFWPFLFILIHRLDSKIVFSKSQCLAINVMYLWM